MKTIEYRDGALLLLDQTTLPHQPDIIETRDYRRVADAIRTLSVRGAPAIGLAAAYALALAAESLATEPRDRFLRDLEAAAAELQSTRPTAVNLFWALQRMKGVVQRFQDEPPRLIADRLLAEAELMIAEDEQSNRRMAELGAELIPDGAQILTHCNTGALATGAIGTALGVIQQAHESGKRVHVWVDETRPLLQGARLTTWELQQAGVPYTLITDSMAAHFMGRGKVDLAIVGADRIAANGDTANKIGTYGVAVLAHAHGLPFYITAPVSTVDLDLHSGAEIPIEERKPEEVTSFGGVRVAPEGAEAANPAFDVTPARLISAIITDKGLIRPPFEAGLAQAVQGEMPAAAVR